MVFVNLILDVVGVEKKVFCALVCITFLLMEGRWLSTCGMIFLSCTSSRKSSFEVGGSLNSILVL